MFTLFGNCSNRVCWVEKWRVWGRFEICLDGHVFGRPGSDLLSRAL